MSAVIQIVNFILAKGLNHMQFDAFFIWYKDKPLPHRFFDLDSEIRKFMRDKEKPVAELDDLEWDRDLAFIVDITEHLHVLHAKI